MRARVWVAIAVGSFALGFVTSFWYVERRLGEVTRTEAQLFADSPSLRKEPTAA